MIPGAEAEPIMYAEAQGVITTKDGQGMSTYIAQGIGRFAIDRGNTVKILYDSNRQKALVGLHKFHEYL